MIEEVIMTKERLKIGIYGLTGCAGDQLTILNCEDELFDLFRATEICSFPMAKSDNLEENLDIAFIEGSVSTEEDLRLLKDVRERTKMVIAIGNCSCYGGPQSGLSLDKNWRKRIKQIYGDVKFDIPPPRDHKPINAYVNVNSLIPGCPIDKGEFLRAICRLVNGDLPIPINYPVCVECKYNENECLLNKNIMCLGPVINAGCNSICVNHNLPCVGCRGPVIEAAITSEFELLLKKGLSSDDIRKRAMLFAGAPMAQMLKKLMETKK